MDTKLLERLRESLLGPDRYATFVTVSPTGSPRGRTMTLVEIDGDGNFWFSTLKSSRKIGDIQQNPQVSMSFRAPPGSVNVEGQADATEDPATKKRMFSPAWNIFGYDGPEDPKWVLIKVAPRTAEFVDAKTRESETFYA